MPGKLNFIYKFADDYNPVYVNGAYGGTTPKNEIVINFFLERMPLPKQEVLNIDDEGKIQSESIEVSPEDHRNNLIRYVSTGVVLSLDSAVVIRDWLSGHIERMQGDKK